MKKRVVLLVLGVSVWGLAISFYGQWDLTIQLLPTLKVYQGELTLNYVFAPGWRIESESKFYSDGLRYQNFRIDGAFGDLDVWGKMYFHARDVRYQKSWLNLEIPAGGGTARLSFNHWASAADYSSRDRDMFGPWPCVEVVNWDEAWKFMGREVHVTGPVMGYHAVGPLTLYIGVDFPHPDRFQIYIPADKVQDFEAEFGDNFWVNWAAQKKEICVRGRIRGYRYTSGGPGDGGYSVAQILLTDPANLASGACKGIKISATCPGPTIRWFEAKSYVGQTVYVQGPVASITGPATYYGHSMHYRIRIGGGGGVQNRVEVIMPTDPGWPPVGISYTSEVCVYGKISVIGGVAVIRPPDLISSSGSPCCTGGLPGMSINWRYTLTWDPFKVTVDLSDCCQGAWFRQAKVELSDIPLCCGLFLDSTLTFTKASGLEKLTFSLGDLYLPCCGLTATVSAAFTPTSKQVSFEPKWRGVSGCFTVYGDVNWAPNTIGGIEVYGFGITCYTDRVKLRAITALDPDKVEDLTDITFYTGEWEYLSLTYTGRGCCGGDLSLTLESWFGTEGLLFGLQRFRFDLKIPLTPTLTVFTKAQWDLADTPPLDWFDVGWSISF